MTDDEDVLNGHLQELRRGTVVVAALATLRTPGYGYALLETLARAACLSADRLGATLLLLELDGQVERLADGRYQRMPGRPGLPAEKLPN